MSRPIVAIVGRPNVGKSTLFNRLVGKRIAVVEDIPGTTRDRLYANISLQGYDLTLVDTGGLETKPESVLKLKVREQVEIALQETDVILFLVDAMEGVMPADREIADQLHRSGKPVVLVANKVDNLKHRQATLQFYELGLGDPVPISAYHGKGIDDLWDTLGEHLPLPSPTPQEEELAKVTIVGRPNVGKSMLLNTILGEERVIVNDIPGTTRDAIDVPFNYEDTRLLLIDSAGIKRRGRIETGIEQHSVLRTLRAIDRADIALLVTDATEFITDQDTHIAGYILQAYTGMILIVNKWDLVETKDTAKWTAKIRQRLKFIPYVPILFLSAKTRQGVEKIMPVIKKVYEERVKRISDPGLNSVIKEAVAAYYPPTRKGKQLSIFSVSQIAVNPPTLLFYVNNTRLLHFSYQRYLENKLRQTFGFDGSPIRLIFQSKGKK